MFGTRWRIFRLFGIPVSVDVSWIIILVMVTGTLIRVFMDQVPGLPTYQYFVMGLGTAILFFSCLLLHEMGHALTARATGLPIRGITLFIFGGVAELAEEPRSAGSEFVMAIAGPLVSAVLGGLFLGAYAVGTAAGWPSALLTIFEWLGWINLTLLGFNMVPAFPLDGGRVLRSALWGLTGSLRRATYWAALFGRGFAWVLIGLGVLNVLGGNIWGGIWLGIIGLFLSNAAQGSYQHVLIRQVLEGEPVRRFMNPEPIVVPPQIDLRTWVEDYVYRYHRKTFPVSSNGHVEGYITTRALAGLPRSEWEHRTVEEVMERDIAPVSIAPEADALDALTRMQRTHLSRLMVLDGDRLVGIVSLKDLLRFLHLKLELEGEDGEQPPRPGPFVGPPHRETPAHP
jgi:Zn-dependent protease